MWIVYRNLLTRAVGGDELDLARVLCVGDEICYEGRYRVREEGIRSPVSGSPAGENSTCERAGDMDMRGRCSARITCAGEQGGEPCVKAGDSEPGGRESVGITCAGVTGGRAEDPEPCSAGRVPEPGLRKGTKMEEQRGVVTKVYARFCAVRKPSGMIEHVNWFDISRIKGAGMDGGVPVIECILEALEADGR